MQEKRRENGVNEHDESTRRCYEAPRLQLLGSLSSLTRGLEGGPRPDAIPYLGTPSAPP